VLLATNDINCSTSVTVLLATSEINCSTNVTVLLATNGINCSTTVTVLLARCARRSGTKATDRTVTNIGKHSQCIHDWLVSIILETPAIKA